MHEVELKTRQIHEKLGDMCGHAVNDFVSRNPIGLYRLQLPAALTIDYFRVDGFTHEETHRYLTSSLPAAITQAAEKEEESEYLEMEEEKGVGYWKKKLQVFKSNREMLQKNVDRRSQALKDAEDQLAENHRQIMHAESMLEFADAKLEVLPLEGTVSEKIEKLKEMGDMRKMTYDKNLTIEDKLREYEEFLMQSPHAARSHKRILAATSGNKDGMLF